MKKRSVPYAGGPRARYALLASAVFLTLFGIVMIYSASSIRATNSSLNSYTYLVKQLAAFAIGGAAAWVLARSDYRRLRELAVPLWGACVALLVATIGFGLASHGARRWIPLGFMNLQPSELAKIACVLLVAAISVDWIRGRTTGKTFGARVFWATVIPVGLVVGQRDLGTALTIVIAVAFVLWLAEIDMRWVVSAIAGVIALVVVGIAAEPYRINRVLAFLDPFGAAEGKGWQTVQGLYALGAGGFAGVGLGMSRQKFAWLPEAHNDFILAIVGEEVGLIGTLAVVAGLAVFVWAGFKIAVGCKDDYGRLVAGATAGMIGFQAVLNMMSVTGLMPVTGKPLPFLSYGGTSMIVTMICLGLLLSVSEYGAYGPRAVRSPHRAEGPAREGSPERRRDGRSHIPGSVRRGSARRRA